MNRPLALLAPLLLLGLPLAGAAEPPEELQATRLQPRIVNGEETHLFPETVAIISAAGGGTVCSGTLIGCGHVLSAAHCFCAGDTAATCGTPDPESVLVFGQSFGNVGVSAIDIAPNFSFGSQGDVAVLTLEQQMTGVEPAAINTVERLSAGSEGTITGFGLSMGGGDDSGMKRTGLVETSACTNVPDDQHVCWEFSDPLGPVGDDSNTCSGDSGGPLFAEIGGQTVLAGVTSGGIAQDCLPEDSSFDSDVFVNREWIADVVGPTLGGGSCILGPAGSPGNEIFGTSFALDATTNQVEAFVDVPPGAEAVRVTLNAEDGSLFSPTDFDLFVKAGEPPTTEDFDCRPFLFGSYEGCEFIAPEEGRLFILVDRFEGEGAGQLTATVYTTDASGCVATDTRMCLNDDRFSVEVTWEDFAGVTGPGMVVPGGTDDSGLFWFFDPANWEQLIKVLDGCNNNGHYWVFAAATTNVGYTITVTDTETDEVREYTNTLGVAAPALTDTEAFATCP